MMYVIFTALVKGFWVLLYNHSAFLFAFLSTCLSGRYPFFDFQSSYVLFIKKKKKSWLYIYTSHNSYMEISENIEHYFQSRDLRMSSC